jgi:hypothetical protein
MESTASSFKQRTPSESTTLRVIAKRLDRGVNWVESYPALLVAVLAIIYLLRLPAPLQTILWYDELHTYYIAQAPTIAKYIELVRNTDLNPPLIYALARLSFDLFGVSSLATRLPAILAFLLGSIAVLGFLSRRVGWLWATAAVALFWYSPSFYYATEARPYGVLLAFFCLTLLSWDTVSARASQDTHLSTRRRGLAGIAIGNTGMMLSHTLAPLSIMPFCIAELFRSVKQRKLDPAVWAALLLPLACGLLSLSSVQKVGGVTYPPVFAASFGKAGWFFVQTLFPVLPALFLFTPVALLIAAWGRRTSTAQPIATTYEVLLVIVSLLTPLLVNMALMYKRGPFFERYCITTALLLYVGIVLFIARQCRANRVAGMLAVLILIALNVTREMPALAAVLHPPPASTARLDQAEPELPFVVADARTFLEMDHLENAAFLSRVYYLTARPSALRYAGTDLWEGFSNLKHYFPIRANFASYNDFAAKNQRFLVYGYIDRPEDWLLRKLIAEGSQVRQIGEFSTRYRDITVYDVTLALAHREN